MNASLPALLCFCLLVATAPAREAERPLRLTLTEAIRMAMEKNLAIKVSAYGPDIAQERVRTEGGAFDPELQAGWEHEMTRTALGAEARVGGFSLGLGGFTPLGTTYTLGANTTAFNDYNGYHSSLSAGLTQPLLRGFGTGVNLAGLRIARVNREASEWVFRQQVINVVTQTIYVYNELYAATRRLDAARRTRDAALRLESDERRRAELGVRIGLDVTTARAEAASREEAVLLAEAAIAQNERFLKQLVTGETATLLRTPVVITPPPIPAVGRLDVEQGVRDALNERPDYRQALLELRLRAIEIVVTGNAKLPRLDLSASLNLLGVQQQELGSSFGFFDDGVASPNSWSVGVVFRLPIPNRSARGRYNAAKLQKAQALLDLHRMEQIIIVEVANAATEVETAHKRIATTREALQLANESLSAGGDRLKAGSATPFEVLELQRRLAESEAAVIKAEADYRNALSEYDRRTGMTLLRNGITLSR